MKADVRIVRAGEDHADAWLALYNRLAPRIALTPAESRHYAEITPGMIDVVALRGREVVGIGCYYPYREVPDTPAGCAILMVEPEERRHGIGSAIYAAVSELAADDGRTHIDADVSDLDPAGGEFAANRGFTDTIEISVFVELDLATCTAPPVDPPPGIRIVSLAEQPDLAHGVWEVDCEAVADIPTDLEAHVPADFETFGERRLGHPSLLHEALMIALDGEEVVGYAMLYRREARPGVADHAMTGVKRAWRGRGVAGALKRAQIAWAKSNGLAALATSNEERNAPIRTLNARYGYRQVEVRTTLRGPRAPPGRACTPPRAAARSPAPP
jgi:GNAT superfamily N-acetyltransferase